MDEDRTPELRAESPTGQVEGGDILPVAAVPLVRSTPEWKAVMFGDTGDSARVYATRQAVLAQDNEGRTPLMHAAAAGNLSTVKLLLDRRAEVDVQDDEGRTALFWAASEGNVSVNHPRVARRTLIAVASQADIIKAILDTGAKPSITRNDGYTPLMVAAQGGHAEVKQSHNTGHLEKGVLISVCACRPCVYC